MIKKIAITGGIGSGKSTVLKLLCNKGYPTFSCDEIYKNVICSREYIEKMKKNFPTAVKDGVIDKKILSNLIFADENKRKLLDSIAHPIIIERLKVEMDAIKEGIVFAEVPLLFEGGYMSLFDAIIVVCRERAARIDAVIARDLLEREAIEKRIAAQFDYDSSEGQIKMQQYNVKILMNISIEKLNKDLDLILKDLNETFFVKLN